MEVVFTKPFVRQLKKLEPKLQTLVCDRVELLQLHSSDPSLKIHKLKGKLKNRYSFSVNYSYRIVFNYISPQKIVLLSVGDHDVYKI